MVANRINFVMIFIGVIIFISAMKIALESLTKENEVDLLISFLIPITYSIIFIPCAYLLALYSEYEMLYIRMKIVYENKGMINAINHKLLNHRFFKIVKLCGLSINNISLIDSSFMLYIYSEDKEDFELFIKKIRAEMNSSKKKN